MLGPWVPFLVALVGRALAGLSVLVWLDGIILGMAPQLVRSVAFYGTGAFLAYCILRQVVDSALTGETPCMNVTVEKGSFYGDSAPWVASGMRGWREAMEDKHVATMLNPKVFPDVALFAVLDGHGGKEVSEIAHRLLASEVEAAGWDQLRNAKEDLEPCLEQALQCALPRLDAKLRSGPSWGCLGNLFPTFLHPYAACGSTACVAAVDFGKREVLVANIGDSRAILVKNGKAHALSEDHKPENPGERARIRAAGGQVIKVGPCHRVDGNLNLSRALGDLNLKANFALPPEKQRVIAYPDSKRASFNGGPQELLILGCDGLFERLSNQDVVDTVWPLVRQGKALDEISKELLHHCCARSSRGRPVEDGTDNETVILIKLPAARTAKESEDGISAGSRVKVHGLESDTGKQLNGEIGIVEGPTAGKADRLDVRLVSSGEVKSLKSTSLSAVENGNGK